MPRGDAIPGDRRGGDVHDPRPLVSGTPVIVGVVVLLIAVVTIVVSLGRDPGLPAHLSQDYTRMMAGTLTADVGVRDPPALGRALAQAGARFAPRVGSLEPEFTLLGGRVHAVAGRPAAAWFYRSAAMDFVLGVAFEGSLDDLGIPDGIRDNEVPPLRIFRKTTQILACWQEGPLVHSLISTLPEESVVRLARRHAAAPPPVR